MTNPLSVAQATDDREPLIGIAALMRMALAGDGLPALGQQLLRRAADHPEHAETLLDLSTVLQFTGQRDIALSMQGQALGMQRLYHMAAAQQPAALRLLALLAPGDLMANTPLEFLIEDSDVDLDLLYVTADAPLPPSVPDHDVLFVAVGESDASQPLLDALEVLLKAWPRPMINSSAAIANLSRDGACELLRNAPGLVLPQSVRVERHTLERVASGALPLADILEVGGFPALVRPVGSHAGHGLVRLADPEALVEYLAANNAMTFFVTPFIDYRSDDGQYRKYRIVLIDDRPYICHMAISDHWMVHYANAGMTESAEKRAEEARFMEGFDQEFAVRHDAALRAIAARARLDYLGIDCAETPDGRLLIFEVDTAMVVHALDPVDLFPYKQPQMRKVFDAFRALLAKKRHRPK
ncbi:MAG: glutathione synthase [Chromatiales bacterium 21-64-14]|nr:MAG: glutathione synthase [Chromatiales bacterium 21-64-14]HQU16780.1 RimK family alpha-L-glutamate ligase [Gammaproteobacteria bacterium]